MGVIAARSIWGWGPSGLVAGGSVRINGRGCTVARECV